MLSNLMEAFNVFYFSMLESYGKLRGHPVCPLSCFYHNFMTAKFLASQIHQ